MVNGQTITDKLEIAAKNTAFSYYHRELLKDAAGRIKALKKANDELTYLLAKEKERKEQWVPKL